MRLRRTRSGYPLWSMLKSHMSKATKLSLILSAILIISGQIYVMGSGKIANFKRISIDKSRIAVLPYDTADFWIFPSCTSTNLTEADFQNIEQLLDSTIDNYNVKQEVVFKKMVAKYPQYKTDKDQFVIKLSRYKRQYIAVINQNGDKEVWINCFCNSNIFDYWKTQRVIVLDGGNCFFNLQINLTKRLIYNLSINGVA